MAKWLKESGSVTNMKRKCDCRSNGQGLVIIIILLAVIGVGAWWLFDHKKTMDRDARAFGREAIQRLTVNHDANFLANNLSTQARLQMPPSQQQYVIGKFTEMGVPNQPVRIEESVTFESHFFEPKGYFTAHLFYPASAATLQIAVSHPVSKWQLDDLTFIPERPR
jgi:hypothetical protein